MQQRTVRLAIATAGVTAWCVAASMTTSAAHAAPYNVKAGSAPSGATVTATLTAGSVSFADTTTSQRFTCAYSGLKAAIKVGVAASGNTIGTINGADVVFGSCSTFAGIKLVITGYGVWNVNVSDSTNGVSTISVTNVRAHVASPSYPCSFDIGASTGSFVSPGTSTISPATFNGYYTNSGSALSVAASRSTTMGLWNVHGNQTNSYCIARSVYKNGDQLSFSTVWTAKVNVTAYNPITIT